MSLVWMAWTWQTAVFFAAILLMLVVMTVLAIVKPETPRIGILRFPTTRGDRLFVSLICAAFIFIAWLRFGGESYWYPAAASLLVAALMFRFA